MSAESAENAAPHVEPQASPLPAPAGPADAYVVFWTAERACCCPARPAVVAVLPPSPDRDHATDLLLCGHHYRAARRTLEAAGATILDEAGQPVRPRDAALLGARLSLPPEARTGHASGTIDPRQDNPGRIP